MGLDWHFQFLDPDGEWSEVMEHYESDLPEEERWWDYSTEWLKISKEINDYFECPDYPKNLTRKKYRAIANHLNFYFGRTLSGLIVEYGKEEWLEDLYGIDGVESTNDCLTERNIENILGYIKVLKFFGIPSLKNDKDYEKYLQDLDAHEFILKKFLKCYNKYGDPTKELKYGVRIKASY